MFLEDRYMSSNSAGDVPTFNKAFTKKDVANFKNQGGRIASGGLPSLSKRNVSFNDPKAKNRDPSTGFGITQLLGDEVSNITDQEISKLINIFNNRSDEIQSSRRFPGVKQTRLIGR